LVLLVLIVLLPVFVSFAAVNGETSGGVSDVTGKMAAVSLNDDAGGSTEVATFALS